MVRRWRRLSGRSLNENEDRHNGNDGREGQRKFDRGERGRELAMVDGGGRDKNTAMEGI